LELDLKVKDWRIVQEIMHYDSSALTVEGTGMTAHESDVCFWYPLSNMNCSATGTALDGVQWTNFYYPSSGPGGLGVHEGRIDTFETRVVDEFREVGDK
jgi:hypothetical protein